MIKAQSAAVIGYASRGFTVDMIHRMMERAGVILKSNEIREALVEAGLTPLDDRGGAQRGFILKSAVDGAEYEDADILRRRWAMLLPKMRQQVRSVALREKLDMARDVAA